jgi:hypothetical protein
MKLQWQVSSGTEVHYGQQWGSVQVSTTDALSSITKESHPIHSIQEVSGSVVMVEQALSVAIRFYPAALSSS